MKLRYGAEAAAAAVTAAALFAGCEGVPSAPPTGPETTIVSHDKACDGQKAISFAENREDPTVLDLLPVTVGVMVCRLRAGETAWVLYDNTTTGGGWIFTGPAFDAVGEQEVNMGAIGQPGDVTLIAVAANAACSVALQDHMNTSGEIHALPRDCTVTDSYDVTSVPTPVR